MPALRHSVLALALLMLTGCHKSPPPYHGAEGELTGPCRKDGTCTGRLVCASAIYDAYEESWHPSEEARYMRCEPQPENAGCHGDADCFCKNCLERCGAAGMRRCAFGNDTWGAGPDVCECLTTAPAPDGGTH